MPGMKPLYRPIIAPMHSHSSKFKTQVQRCMYFQELRYWWQVTYMIPDTSHFIWKIVFWMTPYKFYLQILSFMFDICRIKDFSSHSHLDFSGTWRLGSLHNTNLMRLYQIHISSVMAKISYVALMFLQSLGITSNVLMF